LILTDVPKVQRGFGSLYPEDIERMTSDEAAGLLKAGEFGAGSMRPKIEAAIDFLEAGGKRVVIGDLDEAPAVLRGEAGTEIVPS
jgi:carbamate kinase